MNKWQTTFFIIGILCLTILVLFPPQIVSEKHVQYLFITSGYPIDWFQFVFIAILVIFIAGLGITVNSEDKTRS